MPAFLLPAPEKTKPFLDLRHLERVVDMVQTHLAIETVANRGLADDLHLGSFPQPPATDRPDEGGDE